MILLTLSDVATEFRMSRDTVRAKLTAAGIKTVSSGRRRVYRLMDVIPVLTDVRTNAFAARANAQTQLLEIELQKKGRRSAGGGRRRSRMGACVENHRERLGNIAGPA